MKDISQEIIHSAHRCLKSKSCITSEDYVLCKVEYCVKGEVHFILCKENTECNYKQIFGNQYFCTCPIRKEIYNKYKK